MGSVHPVRPPNRDLYLSLYPDSVRTRKNRLRISCRRILLPFMIHGGFLDPESRKDLIELARDGSAAHRWARRANALALLDDGMTCEAVAKVLFLDDDTIRSWYQLYQEDGIDGRQASAMRAALAAYRPSSGSG